MSETIFHVAAGDKELKLEILEDGRIDVGIGQVGAPFMNEVFTIGPTAAASLAAVVATRTFKHQSGVRTLPASARIREDGEGRLPQMVAQRREQLRHQDDSGDACHCANCELSMG